MEISGAWRLTEQGRRAVLAGVSGGASGGELLLAPQDVQVRIDAIGRGRVAVAFEVLDKDGNALASLHAPPAIEGDTIRLAGLTLQLAVKVEVG